MSYIDSVYTQCEDMQARLASVFTDPTQSKELQQDPSAFLQYVTSPANRNGLEQLVSPGNGKAMDVKLVFDRPILESTVEIQDGRACRPQEKRGDASVTYQIDTERVLESGERFALKDFTRKCEANPTFLQRRLLQHLIAIDKAVASQTALEAAALYGNYSQDTIDALSLSDDDTLIVQTLDAAGQFKPGAMELIQWAATASQFGNFGVFGGRLLDEHFRLSLAGCCTRFGIEVSDLMSLYGFAFAYDRRVAAAMGEGGLNSRGLLASIGTFQLIQYTENPAANGIPYFGNNNVLMVLTTPSGIEVDVTISEVCKVIDIQVQATTKLVALPTDMHEVGDNYEGTNGAAGILVTNPE